MINLKNLILFLLILSINICPSYSYALNFSELKPIDSMVDSNIPSVAYATVYPIAMVFLILFIQIIASAVY